MDDTEHYEHMAWVFLYGAWANAELAQRHVSSAISCTPTSEKRNALTDINIELMTLLDKIKDASK